MIAWTKARVKARLIIFRLIHIKTGPYDFFHLITKCPPVVICIYRSVGLSARFPVPDT